MELNIEKCREASQKAAEAMAQVKAQGPALGWNVTLEQMLLASERIDAASEDK